ncbi:unnamed protein product [Prunus brigantina]
MAQVLLDWASRSYWLVAAVVFFRAVPSLPVTNGNNESSKKLSVSVGSWTSFW